MNTKANAPSKRLEGLDFARFLAFVGMVMVNFKIVMGADADTGALATILGWLDGRAASTFVVLAGVGFGLSAQHRPLGVVSKTIKRAIFLFVLGLLNMLVFEADILHFYAVYFVLGLLLLGSSKTGLVCVVLFMHVAFHGLLLTLNYDTGWEWNTYSYIDIWTFEGFVRNLFYNGWHPVFPWFSFFAYGVLLSRFPLGEQTTQNRLIGFGIVALIVASGLSRILTKALARIDAELVTLAATSPIPPTLLYGIAGIGAASLVIGLCLRLSSLLSTIGLMRIVLPAGRQALTLYIAHILFGMGVIELLGLVGNQTLEMTVVAVIAFVLVALIYANVWNRYFKRGPLEALMRKIAG